MSGKYTISREDWSLHRKGEIDRERHHQKVKEAIKKNLPDIVSEERLTTNIRNHKKPAEIKARGLFFCKSMPVYITKIRERGVYMNLQSAPKLLGNKQPKIAVTKHAVERFMDWRRAGNINVKDAERMLAKIALKGKPVGNRPGRTCEVTWQGLYVVVRRDKDGTLVVLTFNGDRKWRNWYRKTHLGAKNKPNVIAAL